MNQIVEIEGRIRAVTPKVHEELLRQFVSTQADLAAASCLEGFISGYRMGVQFMLAAFLDDDRCLRLSTNNRGDTKARRCCRALLSGPFQWYVAGTLHVMWQ